MDLEHSKHLQTALKLDEKQKRTVRALRRQISSHSTRNTTVDGDHFAKLSEEEIILLRKIVALFIGSPPPMIPSIFGKFVIKTFATCVLAYVWLYPPPEEKHGGG